MKKNKRTRKKIKSKKKNIKNIKKFNKKTFNKKTFKKTFKKKIYHVGGGLLNNIDELKSKSMNQIKELENIHDEEVQHLIPLRKKIKSIISEIDKEINKIFEDYKKNENIEDKESLYKMLNEYINKIDSYIHRDDDIKSSLNKAMILYCNELYLFLNNEEEQEFIDFYTIDYKNILVFLIERTNIIVNSILDDIKKLDMSNKETNRKINQIEQYIMLLIEEDELLNSQILENNNKKDQILTLLAKNLKKRLGLIKSTEKGRKLYNTIKHILENNVASGNDSTDEVRMMMDSAETARKGLRAPPRPPHPTKGAPPLRPPQRRKGGPQPTKGPLDHPAEDAEDAEDVSNNASGSTSGSASKQPGKKPAEGSGSGGETGNNDGDGKDPDENGADNKDSSKSGNGFGIDFKSAAAAATVTAGLGSLVFFALL